MCCILPYVNSQRVLTKPGHLSASELRPSTSIHKIRLPYYYVKTNVYEPKDPTAVDYILTLTNSTISSKDFFQLF